MTKREPRKLIDLRDRSVDDAGRITPAAIARAAQAVCPLAGSIASVGQDLAHRPDAEGRSLSETVDWIVLAHPIEVDEADIARFGKLYPTLFRYKSAIGASS